MNDNSLTGYIVWLPIASQLPSTCHTCPHIHHHHEGKFKNFQDWKSESQKNLMVAYEHCLWSCILSFRKGSTEIHIILLYQKKSKKFSFQHLKQGFRKMSRDGRKLSFIIQFFFQFRVHGSKEGLKSCFKTCACKSYKTGLITSF